MKKVLFSLKSLETENPWKLKGNKIYRKQLGIQTHLYLTPLNPIPVSPQQTHYKILTKQIYNKSDQIIKLPNNHRIDILESNSNKKGGMDWIDQLPLQIE